MLVPRMEVPVVESLKVWSQRSVLKSLRTYHSQGLKFWYSDSVCQEQHIITKWANLLITSWLPYKLPPLWCHQSWGPLSEPEHKSLPIFHFKPSKLHTRQPHTHTGYFFVATDKLQALIIWFLWSVIRSTSFSLIYLLLYCSFQRFL